MKQQNRRTGANPTIPGNRSDASEENVVRREATHDATDPGPRVKVKDGETHLNDPERGRGGEFFINDDGIRTRVPTALDTEDDEDKD